MKSSWMRMLGVAGAMVAAACTSADRDVAKPASTSAASDSSGAGSSLSAELLARGRTDQAIRDTLTQLLQAGKPADSVFVQRMAAIDSTNTTWLKGVVATRGWPGRTLVGAEASKSAFLIVQHAVHDTAFQAEALALMERGVGAGETSGADVAMLADRLSVKRNGRQYYGTQAKLLNGRLVLDPIDDSAHVDERRARLGLPPLAEYLRLLDSMYTRQPGP